MVSDRVQLCKWIFSLSNNICWKDCPIPIGGSWHICWKSAGHIREDFFVPFILFHRIPKKGNAKECSNYCIIALIPHASKVMLKILQARLQQYRNHELPYVQDAFRKGRGTIDQIANIRWIMEKAIEFQKNIYFCFIDYAKPLTVWITINCGKFWKRWEYQTTWPASWETYIQVRKQQL